MCLPDTNRPCLFSVNAFGRCVEEAVTLTLYCCISPKGICVRLWMCQQHRELESLGAREGYAVSLSPFHHAWRVVKGRVKAEEQQIDYPVCKKCVQGLYRQTGNKQRPLLVEPLKHTRANVNIKG